jgi:alpha-amylase
MKKISRILTFVLALTLVVSSFAGGFSMKATAEETTTRVYFYNTDDWAKVNAYVFNASNGQALGNWPGKAATNEGDGWWHVDVPAAPQFMIIFNNGSGSQTKDVPISDASSVYVTVTGKTFTSKAAAEATIGPGPASTTVWFYNSDNWASVNAYVFGATNGEALGGWPGKAASNGGDGWWSVEVPAYPEFKIIFNNEPLKFFNMS